MFLAVVVRPEPTKGTVYQPHLGQQHISQALFVTGPAFPLVVVRDHITFMNQN